MPGVDGKSGNIFDFLLALDKVFTEQFGLLGSFISRNKIWKRPKPKHPRWIGITAVEVATYKEILENHSSSEEDEEEQDHEEDAESSGGDDDNDDEDLTNELKVKFIDISSAKKCYEARVSKFSERLENDKQDRVRMHAVCWGNLSDASQMKIKELPEYEKKSVQKKDIYWLVEAIKLTHLESTTGINLADINKLKKEWSNFRWRDGETVAACKLRYQRLHDRMLIAKCHIDSENERVAYFVENSLSSQFFSYKQKFMDYSKSPALMATLPETMDSLFHALSTETKVTVADNGRQSIVPIAQSFFTKRGKKGKRGDSTERSNNSTSSSTKKER